MRNTNIGDSQYLVPTPGNPGEPYVGGAIALFVAAQSSSATENSAFLQNVLLGSALVVGIVAVLLSFPRGFAVRGAIQRVGEFTLFANIVLLSVLIATGS